MGAYHTQVRSTFCESKLKRLTLGSQIDIESVPCDLVCKTDGEQLPCNVFYTTGEITVARTRYQVGIAINLNHGKLVFVSVQRFHYEQCRPMIRALRETPLAETQELVAVLRALKRKLNIYSLLHPPPQSNPRANVCPSLRDVESGVKTVKARSTRQASERLRSMYRVASEGS